MYYPGGLRLVETLMVCDEFSKAYSHEHSISHEDRGLEKAER